MVGLTIKRRGSDQYRLPDGRRSRTTCRTSLPGYR